MALLEIFNGKLEKIRLQKLLFLFCERQIKPDYYFIPYKFGCYSYSANADLTTMVNKGFLVDDKNSFSKSDNINYLKIIKEQDRKFLFEIKKLYSSLDSLSLMKHTYINYPYFAINSLRANEILSNEEIKNVINARPNNNKTILFTIGYEGVSLEEYLNKLIKNNISVLIDVRKNPLSMKYGFSKSLLKKFCESLGIQYMHFPDVGIESNQRKELNCQKDYDELFKYYKSENLTKTISVQITILDVLKLNKRIALTCFEADVSQCHRKHLAQSIVDLPGFDFELKHI